MLEMKFLKFLTSGFGNFLLALELCAFGCINECYWALLLTWKEILFLDMLVLLVQNPIPMYVS